MIWDEVTANTRFGTEAEVRAEIDRLFQGVATHIAGVEQWYRSALHAAADTLPSDKNACYVDPIAV